jgi:hypothetical protein
MRSVALFSFVLALGALIPAPRPGAYAQDPRQEGPIEIKKCQTISQPGSYKLVNNLTFNGASGSTCLSITASFVTIDLAGFTITGGLPPAETIIAAGDNTTGITVRNGSISAFFTGFGVGLGGDASVVEGLRVAGNGGSGIRGGGISATGIVRGNAVVRMAARLTAGGVGISATGVITGNYTTVNAHFGILAGGGSTVIGNTATNNADVGIAVTCPSNVTDNTATGNQHVNLQLNGTGCNDTNNVAP